jgi:hypothetical protein
MAKCHARQVRGGEINPREWEAFEKGKRKHPAQYQALWPMVTLPVRRAALSAADAALQHIWHSWRSFASCQRRMM